MQKSHNVRNETVHECDVCFKTFAKKDHLVRHENVVHRGVRQTCHLCNKEFSSLDKHMKMKHSHSLQNSTARSVLFPCDNCSETFSKKSELNSHRETSHAIDNPDKFCTICCKQFANLAQHQKIVHNGVNFKCQNCGKGFYDNRELRRHHIKFLKTRECKKEVSIGVCKYNCDFENCDYKTNKKGNMDMHKDSVHLNIKYDCPECNKKLSSRANLNSHVKNVHDKKIVSGSLQKDPYKLKFLCKLCDYTTNRAMHLDRHMLSVHSAAAFETVEQVYQASQARADTGTPPVQQEVNTARPKIPQFASLVQVEGCSQYLRQDYHQTIPTPVQLIAQRRSTEELIGNCSDLSPFTESSFQLVDNLPSIYYV